MKNHIKQLVSTGNWTQLKTSDFAGEYTYNIKVLSFSAVGNEDSCQIKKNLPELMMDGNLWIMKIEVINVSKKPFYSYIVRDSILLVDNDGFQFEMNSDSQLYDSAFGIQNGLNRFQSWTGDPLLQPKIKATGALACFLPDDDSAVYCLQVKKKYM